MTAQQIEVQFNGTVGAFALEIGFSCPMHGISALFGASGSGKTTILRVIAGLQRMKGRVLVDGEAWQDDSRQIFRKPHQREIGYVFQEASLFPHLSVQKNLQYGLQRISPPQRKVQLDDAVELLGLRDLLARNPERLSGGQRQRIAIARALLTSPRLLLMDEPLASLDLQSKLEILPYLQRLHDELSMPVLYVSHAPNEIARLADHLIIIENGHVRASGPLMELYGRVDLARERGADADSIINTTIVEHDEEFQLSYLQFTAGRFSVGRIDLPLGHESRLRVLANDVSITLAAQRDTSILNIFPATVVSLQTDGPAKMLLSLDLSGTPLLARVTRKSAQLLKLAPGQAVYAQIKAVALVE